MDISAKASRKLSRKLSREFSRELSREFSRELPWKLSRELSWKLQESVLSAIRLHAVKDYPQECCGVLLGDRETQCIEAVCPLANKSGEACGGRHFQVDPMELYRVECQAEIKHLEVAGFYHSHPDHPAELSWEDEKYMIPGMIYLIVSLTGTQMGECRIYTKTEPDEKSMERNTDC